MSRTHEALLRAEANFQKKNIQEKYSEPLGQLELIEKIESGLLRLALSEKQILNQDLKEIKRSLKQIEQCMIHPITSFNIQADSSKADHSKAVLSILIDRKKLLLNRFNELINIRKYYNIKKLSKNISEDRIRSSIEKIINELYLKDKVLKKEYTKLDQMYRAIKDEKQTKKKESYVDIDNKQPEETEKQGQRKSIRLRDSVKILILGVLLGCCTLFIAIAPFVGVSVPSSLNIAIFLLLGFFLGLTIVKLAKLARS